MAHSGEGPPYFWTKLRPEGPIKFWGGGPPPPLAHFIRVNRAAARHVTPSQTPVIAVDQPLFTLAKEIQYRLIGAYEEDSFFTWRASREDGVLEYARQVAHWQKSR